MNVLLIPDKFKGSLSAEGVIEALSKGILKVIPTAKIHAVIASDGGDGFLQAVSEYTKAKEVLTQTVDPLGRELKTSYLFEEDSKRAFIEMAKTSGMVLLSSLERNPLQTSTFGTGLQILDAINKGAEAIYVGLGGSATNDGGIGIAKALGYFFFDITGEELTPVGASLGKIDRIQPPEISKLLKDVTIYAVNDVSNPLCGEGGAAQVYGAQKGATKEDIIVLDTGLEHLNSVVSHQFNVSHADVPGAGAAGGTAYGLKTFAGAEFISGIEFILNLAGIDTLLKNEKIDCIITGEGRIDDQTLSGKLINGVMNLGKKHQIPVIAICGALTTEKELLYEQGLQAVIEVRDPEKSLEYNMANAPVLIEKGIAQYLG